MPELFDLAGLRDDHRAAVQPALRDIRFPWLWLRPKLQAYGKLQIPVGTRDLNTGAASPERAHVLKPDKRGAIAGLAWSDGRIEIDTRVTPADAARIFAAEAAHCVDFFWMTEPAIETWTATVTPMRKAVADILHPGGGDAHSWFEPSPYADQLGEALMAVVTLGWSDIDAYQGWWSHQATEAQAQQVRPLIETDTALVGLTGYTAVHRQTCRYVKGWRTKGAAFRQTRELGWQTLLRARAWSGRKPCLVCKPT